MSKWQLYEVRKRLIEKEVYGPGGSGNYKEYEQKIKELCKELKL